MSYAIQAVLLAVPAIGFTSLAIDLSWMQVVNDQLQNSADSAALAGVERLGHPDEVVPTAVLFGDFHSAGNQQVSIDPAKVTVGQFDGTTFTADPTGRFVQVIATTQSATILARIFGMDLFTSTRTSIATLRDQTLCGIVGLNSLDLTGSSHVDSFDSTIGPYLVSKSASAGVCTNALDLSLKGNTLVEGNGLAGPGGTVTVGGSSKITGSTGALQDPLPVPLVVVPGTSLPLPNSLPSAIVLAPGNYFVLGDFDVKGDVTITGETHIYVDGNVTVNGNGFLNTSLDPHNLSIEVIGPHSVQYNGNSAFFGALIAPESSLKLNGTADMFGAVVGGDVSIKGNLELHQDLSLPIFDLAGGHAALVQ